MKLFPEKKMYIHNKTYKRKRSDETFSRKKNVHT